jgi:hypothetical protein
MSQLNLALCPLLLVECNTCNAGFEERDGKRQLDSLCALLHYFEHGGFQLAVLECDGGGFEVVWGGPGARSGDTISELAIALTEARLVAGLEVFVFYRNYGLN